MPSPFPGMDPFLEDPMYRPDLHHRLITAIGDELAGEMSPDFFVRIEERVYKSTCCAPVSGMKTWSGTVTI
jgi:hypothetical protein